MKINDTQAATHGWFTAIPGPQRTIAHDEPRPVRTSEVPIRYAVFQDTVCDGWTNTGTDENGDPLTYATADEAAADIEDDIAEVEQQIKDGERELEDGGDQNDFAVVKVTTDKDGKYTVVVD